MHPYLLLASIGGIAGVAVGAAIVRALLWNGMASIPNSAAVDMSRTVVAFVMSMAVLVGAVIGLTPAATLGRMRLSRDLAEANRAGTGGRSSRLFRRVLVVTQVAFSVVLLIGAGLLLISFQNLLRVDAGFDAERVTTATIFPPPSRYPDQAAVIALSNRVLDAIRTLPGVEAAGMTSNIALSGRSSPATVFASGRKVRSDDELLLPSVVTVTPGYFEALRTPLIHGRYFAESDDQRSPLVAIIDERLAARLWPNEDPVGKGLRRGDSKEYTVIGVVRDVRFGSLAEAEPVGTAYFPHTQSPIPGRLRYIAIKTARDAPSIVRFARAALTTIDPDLPLSDIQRMSERALSSVVSQKLAMGLASLFGGVALFLSVLGIYGVLTYVVAQRRREIAIRLALGSTAPGIFSLFLKEGMNLVSAGLILGVVGALALGRTLQGHVFGVAPADPFVLASVALATGIIALLACVRPAHRAAQVDPVHALNEQ